MFPSQGLRVEAKDGDEMKGDVCGINEVSMSSINEFILCKYAPINSAVRARILRTT